MLCRFSADKTPVSLQLSLQEVCVTFTHNPRECFKLLGMCFPANVFSLCPGNVSALGTPASADQASSLPNVQIGAGICGACPEEKVFSLQVDLR